MNSRKYIAEAKSHSKADNLSLALDLADAGFAVFPCRERGWKRIKGPYTLNGFHDATSDPTTIKAWWKRWPAAIVGLPTGEANGIAVLDLDRKDGKDGFAELQDRGLLPRSPVTVQTPSGGRHLIFRHRDGLGSSTGHLPDGSKAPGVDYKADGGYIIAPGSVMADGSAYTYQRGDLIDSDLTAWPSDKQFQPRQREAHNDNEGGAGLPAEVFREIVKGLPNDDLEYDDWRDVGMAIHHELGPVDGLPVFLEWSAKSEKHDARFLKNSFWRHLGKRRGTGLITGRTVMARAAGEYAITREEAAHLFDDIPAAERDQQSAGLTFQSPADCATRVEREYVIKGMVARGDIGCIVGAPGVGKSLLGPHLGYTVAQGRNAFGMRTRPGKVFYVAAEDEHGMRNRVTALHKRHGDADGFTLVGGVSDLLSKGSRNLRDLKAAVERERPALIFLDTLAMAFPGLEENTAEGMGRVVAAARSLTKWGAAVLLIHHDTKDGQQGLPRGHSLLNGALDMSIHLTKDESGIVRGRLTKNRNGPCDRDIAFRIDSVALGVDGDGDPVTAGLCDELDATHAPAGVKLSPAASAALDILTRLISKQRRVSESEWREACASGREVSAAQSRDNRVRTFRTAVGDLVAAGRVIFESPFYRLTNAFDEFEDENDALI